jgi:hypothetical protein
VPITECEAIRLRSGVPADYLLIITYEFCSVQVAPIISYGGRSQGLRILVGREEQAPGRFLDLWAGW